MAMHDLDREIQALQRARIVTTLCFGANDDGAVPEHRFMVQNIKALECLPQSDRLSLAKELNAAISPVLSKYRRKYTQEAKEMLDDAIPNLSTTASAVRTRLSDEHTIPKSYPNPGAERSTGGESAR